MKKVLVFVAVFLILGGLYASATPEILEKRIIEVSKVADKSVAFIKVRKQVSHSYVDPFFDFFRQFGFNGPSRRYRPPVPRRYVEGLGSGFVIDDKAGYIVTNNHVISDADEIDITIHGRTFKAKLVGTDPKTDIGLVKLLHFKKGDIKALPFADSDKIKVGSFAIAIGNPFGLSKSITFGIVSAKGRSGMQVSEYENFIQTDAAINPGNSGGPLLNIKGEVIGMNTAIFSKSGGYMGIGFAVPSNMIKKITAAIRSGKKIQRAVLGITVQTLQDNLKKQFSFPERENGVLVSSVAESSPAEKAGIRPGDIIVAFNGKKTAKASVLRNVVAFSPFNKKLSVDLYRDGKKMRLWVTLTSTFVFTGEDDVDAGGRHILEDFGFSVVNRHGKVVVNEVQPNSLAMMSGLRRGDVILSVNKKRVVSVKEMNRILRESDSILLYIDRHGRKSYLVINR